MTKQTQFSLYGIHEFIKTIKTQAEARQYAIDWQNWVSENENISYAELAEWGAIFEDLATRFDLTDEFKENAII